MKSTIWSIVFAGIAAIGFGQDAPPAPAAPPAHAATPAPGPVPAEPARPAAAAPLPAAPAMPGEPALAPMPPMPAMDFDFDFDFDGIIGGVPGGIIGGIPGGVIADVHGALDKMKIEMDAGKFRDAFDKAHIDMDVMRDQLEAAKEKMNEHKFDIERSMNDAWMLAQSTPRPSVAPMPPMPARGFNGLQMGRRGGNEERMYERGTQYLDRREWDKAVDAFDQVIEAKGTKADGAYYWKAYALAKEAQSDKALTTLADLQKSFPNSRWLNDAKALDAEVRQNRGQAVSPEKEGDEDLKLLAINSLINNDPDRAVPLLQNILQSRNPPKVKERALFVLAQTQTPQARDVVIRFAKGGGNPDLQAKAVEYLGVYGGTQNMQVLSDIYSGTNDPSLRRTILQGFMRAGDKERLLNAARTEQNQELRTDAIRYLGRIGAQNELAQMYTAETSQDGKIAIIDGLYQGENADKLIEIARSEKDPKIRMHVVHRLGNLRRQKVADALVSMYSAESDRGVKEQIMRSLYNEGAAKEVVDVARKENDPELKRAAVRYLSNMKSKEATDYLIELLNK